MSIYSERTRIEKTPENKIQVGGQVEHPDEWAIFYIKDGNRLSGGHKTLSAAVLFLAKMQIAGAVLGADGSLPYEVIIDHVLQGKRQHINFDKQGSFGLL